MTEALPIPVTSLLPVVIFPLFGIMSTDEACKQYLKVEYIYKLESINVFVPTPCKTYLDAWSTFGVIPHPPKKKRKRKKTFLTQLNKT